VQVTIAERIPYIDGELPREQAEERNKVDTAPPAWQDGRYAVTLVRDKDKWRITDMRLIDKLPKEPPATVSPASAASTETPGATPASAAAASPTG